jgi:hypothetical protein
MDTVTPGSLPNLVNWRVLFVTVNVRGLTFAADHFSNGGAFVLTHNFTLNIKKKMLQFLLNFRTKQAFIGICFVIRSTNWILYCRVNTSSLGGGFLKLLQLL